MGDGIRRVCHWLAANWEKLGFSVFGVFLLGLGTNQLWRENVTVAVTSLAFGIFAFAFGSLARFKKVKGFGIEAELWEDKKKEAELLVEKFKALVEIQANEIVVSKVKAGRFGSGDEWSELNDLFDRIKRSTDDIGGVDLSRAAGVLESYYIFDKASEVFTQLREHAFHLHALSQQNLKSRFPEPIRQTDEYAEAVRALGEIIDFEINLLSFASKREASKCLRELASKIQSTASNGFSVDVPFPDNFWSGLDELEKTEGGVLFGKARQNSVSMVQ